MKLKSRNILLILAVFGLCAFPACSRGPAGSPSAGAADRTPYEITEETVRLAVFHPTAGNVRILEALRENGLLTVEDLLVVGIYHEKQNTDFERAETYVRENMIDWFTFRAVSGEINASSLFRTNGCSGDYEEIFRGSDGVIFFGGEDIPPRIYGRKAHPLTGTRTPCRHFFEISMIFHLLGGDQDPEYVPLMASAPEYPVLGICLGSQSLNVGTGGTLIQDIPSEVYGVEYQEDAAGIPDEAQHRNPFARLFPEYDLTSWSLHPIRLLEEGRLCSEWGFSPEDTPLVLSSHHQMLDDLGRGLRALARSLDGRVIEAVDHSVYPHVLGVQFHPEAPLLWDDGQTFRFKPDGSRAVSMAALLRENPPSVEFHKKLWGWFSERLRAYHSSRSD